MAKQAKKCWDYIRFGEVGDCIYNDSNGREIVRVTSCIDTLWAECKCFENGDYVCNISGKKAVDWLLQQ